MKSKIGNNLFHDENRTKRSFKAEFLLVAVMLLVSVLSLNAMTYPVPPPQLTLEGKLNCPVISENGGIAYLQLTVKTPAGTKETSRRPVNLAVVIDRSGSMSDQKKMDFAKRAFATLIDQLKPDDIVSLVVYDDVVDVLRRAKKVGSDRSEIRRMLDEISPRGSTNLGGGLMEGLRQAERYAGKEYVNRVVLLSDGLANVGVTDPGELQRTARRYRSRSISVSTMGVGLDYNENLMMALSESGGGNYYFIEHPSSLASIVRKELDMTSSVAAQNASISITLGDHVSFSGTLGCDHSTESGRIIIPIGDLYSGETREFTIELQIPSGSGKRSIASGELNFESRTLSPSVPSFSAGVRYSRDVAEVNRNRDLETQAKADIAVSAKKVEQAMEAIDNGDQAAAASYLMDAKETMSSSPAASSSGMTGAAIRVQKEKVESYEKTVREESDSRRAKKSIQYDNYRTRTNKK
jgi:Ca-activated chloride channel family protein